MKMPIKTDMENEIRKVIKMVPWLQRGNIKEISFRPNHPAVIIYRSIDEAANSESIIIRLEKRIQKLFLMIDQLEIEERICGFQYGSPADNLANYLLEQHPRVIVSLLDVQGAIPDFRGTVARDALRKMKYWKAFEQYFMPIHTKQKFQIIDRIIMSSSETKKLLEAFGIKWQEPELLA